MIVNFRAREISRGAEKLTQTPTLIKKNNPNIYEEINWIILVILNHVTYIPMKDYFLKNHTWPRFSPFFLKNSLSFSLTSATPLLFQWCCYFTYSIKLRIIGCRHRINSIKNIKTYWKYIFISFLFYIIKKGTW